jgi:hypothetical protein
VHPIKRLDFYEERSWTKQWRSNFLRMSTQCCKYRIQPCVYCTSKKRERTIHGHLTITLAALPCDPFQLSCKQSPACYRMTSRRISLMRECSTCLAVRSTCMHYAAQNLVWTRRANQGRIFSYKSHIATGHAFPIGTELPQSSTSVRWN